MPDGALFPAVRDHVYMPTAALAVTIVSPNDETGDKIDFYAAHGVRELVIADSQKREIDWLGLREDPTYQPIERSMLLALGAAELAERISCPH